MRLRGCRDVHHPNKWLRGHYLQGFKSRSGAIKIYVIVYYLSTSNLLKKTNLIDLEDIEQIKIIEKATNDEIYEESELLDLYKRFQFDINELLNFKNV